MPSCSNWPVPADTAQPLAGRTIVVTRPLAQSGPLAEGIRQAGGQPLIFPLLDIQPIADTREVRAAAQALGSTKFAIFISPNAVDHALPLILAAGPWPQTTQAAAVGPGTVQALAEHGVTSCLLPETRFDSEGLLALPAFAEDEVRGKRIIIFRGDGGRELLADTLRSRGANVHCVTCYQRRGPTEDLTRLRAAWRETGIDAFTLSSSEALRHLLAALSPEERLRMGETPLFVPHARIAETARDAGLSRIVLTEPADAGLLAGLCAYNWPFTP